MEQYALQDEPVEEYAAEYESEEEEAGNMQGRLTLPQFLSHRQL